MTRLLFILTAALATATLAGFATPADARSPLTSHSVGKHARGSHGEVWLWGWVDHHCPPSCTIQGAGGSSH
jgi:hypothetical protein